MERNKAIDILKFFAVLLIVNSHFDDQYVCCKELATGGAIGDALFFFCSGYTLFLGRLGSFDAWYKRRVRRIYPSVIALAFLSIVSYGHDIPFLFALHDNAGWFVGCIMIYYILLYFVRRYCLNRLKWIYGITIAIVLVWYALFLEPIRSNIAALGDGINWLVFCHPMDKIWIYQWNYFKWGFFFLFMLMGANLGLKEITRNAETQKLSMLKPLAGLVCCTFAFYALPMLIQLYPDLKYSLILSLVPLSGICFFFYSLCKTSVMQKLLATKYVGRVIATIGGLCLEIYLVQPLLHTKALNYLFPLNLLILFIAIVFVAYICRSLGRIIQQTFCSEDGYKWTEIFRL